MIKNAGKLGPYAEEDRQAFSAYADGTVFEVGDGKEDRQRTIPQNNSMYLYERRLANDLNDSGQEIKRVIEKKSQDVPWRQESIHCLIWVPVQEAIIQEVSSTKLTTVNMTRVYNVVSRNMSQLFGVNTEWPSNR